MALALGLGCRLGYRLRGANGRVAPARPGPAREDATAEAHRKALEERMSQRLSHRVAINPAKEGKGGKITLTYKNTQELEEIITALCGDDFLL